MFGLQLTRHAPFAINVSSAVSLVFINRGLMRQCDFHYVGLLGALHMGVTALAAMQNAPLTSQRVALRVSEVLFFMACTLTSLVSMNLSLLLNHVGVYQSARLGVSRQVQRAFHLNSHPAAPR